ncbi:M14 family metallopeptidase [Microvirga zambiensis]|uniref:M14 family metallopeptidase n=1 Tax=Microvirga zambiensis TaxID=1402137 RepID=UPI00191D8739|nr:M14 family metallopeptidase [Microvirga zambiensis]
MASNSSLPVQQVGGREERRLLTDRLEDSAVLTSVRSSFSAAYNEARGKFVAALPQARAYVLPDLIGPDGEELAVDVAWVGDPEAACVMVAISGVHGPEGFCGSGIQMDWLTLMKDVSLPKGVALLFIHGLNPHGFAWNRRVTQEGCDLNRNFVDFAVGAPANPGYDALRPHFVPPALEGPAFEAAQEAIRAFKHAHGERAFQMARKAGQYSDPDGMFFGGFEPTWSARTLDAIAREHALDTRKFVAVIDVHTGLGPYGYGELQSEHRAASTSHGIAERMFGPSVTSADLGTSSSIPIEGTLQLYWERLIGDGRHLYLALEYGTFDIEAAQRVLLADQWLHVHGGGDRTSAFGREVRQRMRAHFCPDDPIWQEAVLFRGRQVLRQTLSGLTQMTQDDLGLQP